MTGPAVLIAVEDELSAAVVRRLVAACGRDFTIDRTIIARGNTQLRAGMPKFSSASRVIPHIVLTDLDRLPCPLELLQQWRAVNLPPGLLFRIAVREVEAWLLADRNGMANFLSIPTAKLPFAPENEADPKQTLINLARHSRRRRLSLELVPAAGSSNRIGPLYNSRLVQFVTDQWDVDNARSRAPSLDKFVMRLSQFLPA